MPRLFGIGGTPRKPKANVLKPAKPKSPLSSSSKPQSTAPKPNVLKPAKPKLNVAPKPKLPSLQPKIRKPRTHYYNSFGKLIKINPQRSRLMKQVMMHRKGIKLKQGVRTKISLALKRAHSTGRTKHGRPLKRRKPQKR
jgi:hypothetical protein